MFCSSVTITTVIVYGLDFKIKFKIYKPQFKIDYLQSFCKAIVCSSEDYDQLTY